jgi:hypothetical protein
VNEVLVSLAVAVGIFIMVGVALESRLIEIRDELRAIKDALKASKRED